MIFMTIFFQNPWVVGIGRGIVSGIIVFFISNQIMDRKNNTEYAQHIQSANSEVISHLKPYIADNGLPNQDILDAIISAVSRKYKVKKDEMFPVMVYCQELIYEIIGNVYVSNDKKKEYTEHLSNYITNLKTDALDFVEEKSTDIKAQADYRQKLNKQYSLILSITATFSAMCVFTLIVFLEKGQLLEFLFFPFEESNVLILSIAITISCLLPLTTIWIVQKERTIYKKKHTPTHNDDESRFVGEAHV